MSIASVQTVDHSLLAEDDQSQYLSFGLGEEEYGIDILRIQEIKGWDTVTSLPNTPDYILGVINLRGAVVPIVNIRVQFNLPRVPYDSTTVVIVVRVENEDSSVRTMGIVVDAVSDVHNVSNAEIKPPPEYGGSCRSEFITGLATVEENMLIILDIDRLMNEGVLQELKKEEESS